MPVRAVTTRFMYKGLCTIPDVLTYRTPVILPEDEVEGEAGLVVLIGRLHCVLQELVVRLNETSTWLSSSAPWRAPAGVRFFP